jgi:hypothetical protein
MLVCFRGSRPTLSDQSGSQCDLVPASTGERLEWVELTQPGSNQISLIKFFERKKNCGCVQTALKIKWQWHHQKQNISVLEYVILTDNM